MSDVSDAVPIGLTKEGDVVMMQDDKFKPKPIHCPRCSELVEFRPHKTMKCPRCKECFRVNLAPEDRDEYESFDGHTVNQE